MTGRRFFAGLLGPDIPAHLRDEFTLLTADHMRGQARLLFIGFILSLPICIYGASPGAGPVIAYGTPLLVLALSVTALVRIRRPIDDATDVSEARAVIDSVWQICLLTAAVGSIWCIASWASAPVGIRLYYPAIMSLGALITGYCLMAVRSVGMTVLLVTMGPVVVVLLGTGELMDRVLALTILIAAGFQLVMMVRHQGLLLSLVEARHRSGELARRDPLTGLANRRALLECFERFAARGTAVRLMVVDIDRFKTINDRHGHAIGDQVIIALARLLSDATGEKDLVARLGGEEFALILANQNIEQAARTAEILRRRVRAELSAAIGHEKEVSASFGLAQLAPGEALSDLARRSDLALYEAKNTGRDKVSLAPVDKPSLAHGHPVLISSRTAA